MVCMEGFCGSGFYVANCHLILTFGDGLALLTDHHIT